MNDLTEFLLARITEDEQRSVASPYSHVQAGNWITQPTGRTVYGCERCDGDWDNMGDWYVFRHSTIPGCDTLRLLSLPYAGHPAYRPEWRP